MRAQIITLDGVDKTGKDSVERLFVKKTNAQIMVINRSYISQIVYARIYDRRIDEDFFIHEMKNDVMRGRQFFLLTAQASVILQRCVENNEHDINNILEIESHLDAFNSAVKTTFAFANVITIDNSIQTIEQTVNELMEYV